MSTIKSKVSFRTSSDIYIKASEQTNGRNEGSKQLHTVHDNLTNNLGIVCVILHCIDYKANELGSDAIQFLSMKQDEHTYITEVSTALTRQTTFYRLVIYILKQKFKDKNAGNKLTSTLTHTVFQLIIETSPVLRPFVLH